MALRSTNWRLPRTLARMQQHVLDDGVCALAVLDHLFKIAFQHLRKFVEFLPFFFVKHNRFESVTQLIDQFLGESREIIYKVQRILDLMSNARGELAERCQLLGLDQTVLRGAQIVEQ